MSTINRKPITAPVWVRIAIAVAFATALTLIAFLLTMDASTPVGGKSNLMGAVLVLPLAWAAKSEWPPSLVIAFAFLIYFAICLSVVWLSTREKRLS
jgi:hypothetical protein